MGAKVFIEYDREVFLSGQMLSGKVHVSIDKSLEIRAVELTLSGKAKCRWYQYHRYGGFREAERVSTWCYGKEIYIKTTLRLAGDGQKFELPIGDYQYPFSVLLPPHLPPSYSGTYGGISYYGKAKLNLLWALDKSDKKHFLVENPIDLNRMTELNQPYRQEESKMFCCWCCTTGPLTAAVQIPRFGYVHTESIPISVDIDNGSRVEVNYIKFGLNQIIHWRASGCTKEEKNRMKSHVVAGVGKHASHSATEYLKLGPNKYPNTGNCLIIQIRYELVIEMEVSVPHSDLEMRTPITIGDIPLRGGSVPDASPMEVGLVPPEPDAGFGFNSDLGASSTLYTSDNPYSQPVSAPPPAQNSPQKEIPT